MWIAPHQWAYTTAPNTDRRREPFEWIELDQSSCENLYGFGLCQALLAAGLEKCFNTIGTCQRTDNYVDGILTLRFCRDTQRLPNDGNYYFPLLVSSKVKPSSINPGGGDRSASALGTRATLTVVLRDGPHTDRIVDKYAEERISGAALFSGIGYNPFERSTFWRKWSARNLYKVNRAIRHCSGYIDENGLVTQVVKRDFLTTSFAGPTPKARITIEAKDILTKTNNDKAQAPKPSSGKLQADITSGSGISFTLEPAGIGNAEYPPAGIGRIGSELVFYIRPFADTVIVIIRGMYGTVAAAHGAGDTFQQCLVFSSQTPSQILRTLLVDYSGIDPARIDAGQWAAETAAFLPRLYTTIIAEPTGVAALIGEISEQMYLYVWFDERTGMIKLRAVRPSAGDTVVALDSTKFVLDSVDVAEQADQQITRVIVNYAPRNYVGDMDDITNYAVTDVFGDFVEEGPARTNGIKAKTIFSRWLTGTDGAAAVDLGESLLARYKVPPRKIEFKLDAKDRALWVGDFISVSSVQAVDPAGLVTALPAQVMSVVETEPGTTFSYVAHQFAFEAPPTDKSVEIAIDSLNVNLRTLYDARYATPPDPGEPIMFTVRPGIVVGSSDILFPAIDVGAWPEAPVLSLKNKGVIAGKGGAGGKAPPFLGGAGGRPGGPALKTTIALLLDNTGIIGGGGGGGGAGNYDVNGDGKGGAGGGGAGRNGGPGGPAAALGTAGTDGTLYFGGVGGVATVPGAAAGGAGGALGLFGSQGFTSPFPNLIPGEPPGAAGASIVGAANITFIFAGDIRGPQIP